MNLNQTLQDKFPHLEVSVLKLSEVQKDNGSFRIDSEPFKKSNLCLNEDFVYERLSKIALINPSKTEISHLDKNTKVTFLSMQNLGNGYINDREYGKIQDFENGYTYFAENDILIAKITPCMEHGKCAIAFDLKNKIGFGSTEFNVFRIHDSRFLKEFVFCYLNRESIRKIATDNMVGTSGRQRVPTFFYEKLLIPLFPMPFQVEIEKMVKDSHFALEQSKALYKEAENLLYTELELNPQNPLQSIYYKVFCNLIIMRNYTIATLKESFLKTGRLDSEYYQLKYEEIESFIKSYQGGFGKLEFMEIKDSNFTPKAKEKYRYIELANIGANGNISAPLEEFGEYLPTRARRIVEEGDLIISSIEGSLSSCALITEEFDNCIVSTGFYVLKAQFINSETLLVLFKSKIFQDYLKKFPSGTILTAISKEELQNILIPKIDSKIQESIAQHIQKSFALRAEAKNLLNTAKQRVEEAIKNGGGANNALLMSTKLDIFRIYLPQIKVKLKESKLHYRLAEWLLYEELLFCNPFANTQHDKVKTPQCKHINYTIKTLKQSFGANGRLDSEYYQAKYEQNEKLIKSKPHVKLGDLVAIKKSIEPGSEAYTDSGIPFIRVSNLTPFGIGSSEICLDSNDCIEGELESLYPKKDTILLSKDGSIGIAYCVEKDMECVTSGAILHLHIKDKSIVLPQYLALILNSHTTQLQAQRDSGGSIIAHWKIEEIQNVLIPLLDIHIQKEIATKIAQSFALRAKSKSLLENAKLILENKIRESS